MKAQHRLYQIVTIITTSICRIYSYFRIGVDRNVKKTVHDSGASTWRDEKLIEALSAGHTTIITDVEAQLKAKGYYILAFNQKLTSAARMVGENYEEGEYRRCARCIHSLAEYHETLNWADKPMTDEEINARYHRACKNPHNVGPKLAENEEYANEWEKVSE